MDPSSSSNSPSKVSEEEGADCHLRPIAFQLVRSRHCSKNWRNPDIGGPCFLPRSLPSASGCYVREHKKEAMRGSKPFTSLAGRYYETACKDFKEIHSPASRAHFSQDIQACAADVFGKYPDHPYPAQLLFLDTPLNCCMVDMRPYPPFDLAE
jgi:hypothetical protein